jgi:hypothetical protein
LTISSVSSSKKSWDFRHKHLPSRKTILMSTGCAAIYREP